MTDSEFATPLPNRRGMRITDDTPGTRLCLSWAGSKPWGWWRIIVPLGVLSFFISLGTGPRGPFQLAWEQLTAPGPRDIGDDIFLGVITCISLYLAWMSGHLLGQFAGYLKEISFDANEQLVIVERRGWGIWGRKSTTLLFGQLQFLSLSVKQEGRGSFPLNLRITYRSRATALQELSFKFQLLGCDRRTQALEFLLSIGRVLSAKGYMKGVEGPKLTSWQLALPFAGPRKVNDQDAAVSADDELLLDNEVDDEEEEGEEFDVIPIPVTADFGREEEESAGARTVIVDQRLAAKVDVTKLNEKLVFTRVEEWKPGERVRFVRDRAPALVFGVAAVFGAVFGGGLGGWPVFGFLEGVLGNGTLWWPGAVGLSAVIGAAVLGFIAWNQLQEQVVDIDWPTRSITIHLKGERHERSFNDFRGLQLSGTTRSQSSSGSNNSGTIEYGCRLDLVLADRDLPLLVMDSWESNQAAARDQLQPLGNSLAQSLGLKCEWESHHRTDPDTVRRALTFTMPQQVVLATLAVIAVIGIGRGVMQRNQRIHAADAIRNLSGVTSVMTSLTMQGKSVYKDFWKVEFKNDAEIDAHLATLRPELLKIPELGLEFEDSPLTDAGLRQLDQMTGLRVLTIFRTQISDPGIQALSGCRELVYLNVYGSQMTDQGVVHLEGLTKLRFLFAGGTQITDQGLTSIGKLPALEYLHLTGSAVTAQGVKQFQAAHPKVEVEFAARNQ